jgi:arylsulfatase A-like enzyme
VFDWLETKDEQRFFLWVHYIDPHWPYAPPKPFSRKHHSGPELTAYFEERAFEAGSGEEASTDIINNEYDGEVSYVDEQIGKLLDALRSREDDWKNTIVVVLSDHGEGLRQHGESKHGGVWKEQLHVALLMRIPGHTPARIDRLMSVADVVPTLMGLIELPAEDAFRRQASGFDRLSIEPGTTFIFSQESSADHKKRRRKTKLHYSLTGDEWKCVFGPDGEASLFQLSTDPHELVDVSENRPEIVERLHAILVAQLDEQEKRLAIYRATSTANDGEIDPTLLEQMRTLGYIE